MILLEQQRGIRSSIPLQLDLPDLDLDLAAEVIDGGGHVFPVNGVDVFFDCSNKRMQNQGNLDT